MSELGFSSLEADMGEGGGGAAVCVGKNMLEVCSVTAGLVVGRAWLY